MKYFLLISIIVGTFLFGITTHSMERALFAEVARLHQERVAKEKEMQQERSRLCTQMWAEGYQDGIFVAKLTQQYKCTHKRVNSNPIH